MSFTELATLFSSTGDSALTLTSSVCGILVALALGIAVSLTYLKTSKTHHSQTLVLTLTILPAVVAAVILLIGSDIARAFSMAGVFALIRFRSVPGDARDILYILVSSAVGLACGLGFLFYAVLFCVVLCLAMLLLSALDFGTEKRRHYHLKITVPESLDFKGVFDEVIARYANDFRLEKIRTADLGTVFELTYAVALPDDAEEKRLLDELRCRNGNLDVVLNLLGESSEKM